jgi:energy-coupling factor transporter ATP-binding protein EcfA2
VAAARAGRFGLMPGPGRLEVESVSFAYPGGQRVLHDVSLSLVGGRTAALIGPNGAGKSTLALLIAGLLPLTEGRILLDGQDLADVPLGERARSVGMVFQDPDLQIFSPTTRQEVAFGPHNLLDGPDAQRRTNEALAQFGLEAVADLPPADLSYGLRRKLTVAAIYALRPRFLLLDEPTLGLDPGSADQLMAALDGLRPQGHGLLLLTHDLDLVVRYAQDCLLLAGGRILAAGPPSQVLMDGPAMRSAGLATPPMAQLAGLLAERGQPVSDLSIAAIAAAIGILRGETSR